ncbi:aminoacetone oxidase family FAD-binding enzyme, partial [bacterium]
MAKYDVLIVGGGASGIVAAISAARAGKLTMICEKNPRLGRKLLVSGSGRCNLANEDLSEAYYNHDAQALAKSIFAQFGKNEVKEFFDGLGLKLYSQNKRIFPVTNQAASVLKVLEMELKRLGVTVELGFEAVKITHSKNGFAVSSRGNRSFNSDNVVISVGGKAYPALGSDEGGYALAKQLGHSIIEPVPSVVPLVIKDKICHLLQGQKISAKVWSVIDGKKNQEVEGDVLFTKYGLSGTAILDISQDISLALNRQDKTEVFVCLDLVPFMEKKELENELRKRINKNITDEDILVGILPNKFAPALKDLFAGKNIEKAADELKNKSFRVLATRGWNETEFA